MKNKKRVLALMLAGVLTLGCFPTTVGAVNNAYDGTKPADGTTKKQPFLAGTGGSTNFRIPGLVTLNDGTLVASSDAGLAEVTAADWIRSFPVLRIMVRPGAIPLPII